MKSLRTLPLAGFLLAIVLSVVSAQSITTADAKNHIGERETVCALVAGKHVAAQSQGSPTFVDLDNPYPSQTFTVLVWERDKTAVGTLPSSGQICVTGTVVLYRGKPEIVLHTAASWSVPKVQAAPPPQLSNDNHYTNVNGEQVHSPAYSNGGVPGWFWVKVWNRSHDANWKLLIASARR